jgi:hypothetical protein
MIRPATRQKARDPLRSNADLGKAQLALIALTASHILEIHPPSLLTLRNDKMEARMEAQMEARVEARVRAGMDTISTS